MSDRTATAIDGDSGEVVEIRFTEPLRHCFIVRLDDELLDVVLRHQALLKRVTKTDTSRAAAVREVLRRALPKPKKRPPRQQLDLFGVPRRPDYLAQLQTDDAVERVTSRRRK